MSRRIVPMEYCVTRTRVLVSAVGLVLASVSACVGSVDEAPGGDPAGAQSAGPGAMGGPAGPSPSTKQPPVGPGGLARLTLVQYQNTVRDLLGEDITLPPDLEPDTQITDGFTNMTAAGSAFSAHAVEQLTTAAHDLAAQIFASPERGKAFLRCAPQSAGDMCVGGFIRSFGLRAFRRPLEPVEITELESIVTTVSATLGLWAGLEHVLATMLQSVPFLYRVELGDPGKDGELLRRYSGYEVASRLSYFLWDSTPDDELLAAAGRGELGTTAGLGRQTARLLGSGRTRTAIGRFFSEYLHLDRLDNLQKDVDVFPGWNDSYASYMKSEVLSVIDYLTWGKVDFREFLDGRTTFLNKDLAAFYGLPPVPDERIEKVTLPAGGPRVGVLGLGGVLALNARATRTSPTLRGRFIRERLLCQPISEAPAGVDTTLPEPPAGASQTTMRDRVKTHMSNPTCSSCHAPMDGVGLVMEKLDGVGLYRQRDGGSAIDTSGDLDGVAVKDLPSLAAALRARPEFASCMVRQVYRFATSREPTASELPVLDRLGLYFVNSGYRFTTLMSRVAQSDSFRYAATPTEEVTSP